MTAVVLPFPARHVVHTAEEAARRARRPANDGDLAASLDEATRRGDVIGAIKRAAQAPRRGNRPAKIRDGGLRTVEAIRVEQATAWIEALIEIADHGATPDLLGAMRALVLAMDGNLRTRAQARLEAIENGEPVADVAKLRRELARMRAPTAPPPSGPRSTTWLRQMIDAKRAACDVVGDAIGELGAGCYRLGGVQLNREDAAEITGMLRELSAEEIGRGNVPRMARMLAERLHAVDARAPLALEGRMGAAVRALLGLAETVERGGVG